VNHPGSYTPMTVDHYMVKKNSNPKQKINKKRKEKMKLWYCAYVPEATSTTFFIGIFFSFFIPTSTTYKEKKKKKNNKIQ
jgi:hypothetical protein